MYKKISIIGAKPAALFFAAGCSLCFGQSQAPYLDWANAHESGSSWGFSVCTDLNKNVFITGYFSDTLFLTTLYGEDTLVAVGGGDDCYVQKFDDEGNIIWANAVKSTGFAWGKSIIADSAGNVYVCGLFSGTTDFDPSPIDLNITTVAYSEIFVLKFDVQGELLWVKTMQGNSDPTGSSANDLTLDPNNDLLMTGEFSGTVDFDPGPLTDYRNPGGVFIQKLDTAGNLIWIQTINSTGSDAIVSDALGSVYITGTLIGTADFDPGASVFSHSSNGASYRDEYTLKLDQFGNFKWVIFTDGSDNEYGEDIDIDAAGNVYVVGRFFGTVDFNPGIGVDNRTIVGNQDAYIRKVDSLGNFIWVKTFGGVFSSAIPKGLVIDSSTNIYLSGYYNPGVAVVGKIDLDPGLDSANFESNGFSDIFLQKLDSAGNYIWGNSIGGISGDLAEDINIDLDNNVYITGRFVQSVNFNPNGSTYMLTATGITSFVAKYEEGFVGLLEPEDKIEFVVYPNPVQNEINLSGIDTEISELIIFSLDGQKVFHQNNFEENKIDVSELVTGIYILKVITATGVYSAQILKE